MTTTRQWRIYFVGKNNFNHAMMRHLNSRHHQRAVAVTGTTIKITHTREKPLHLHLSVGIASALRVYKVHTSDMETYLGVFLVAVIFMFTWHERDRMDGVKALHFIYLLWWRPRGFELRRFNHFSSSLRSFFFATASILEINHIKRLDLVPCIFLVHVGSDEKWHQHTESRRATREPA